jgi:hypothetical protein
MASAFPMDGPNYTYELLKSAPLVPSHLLEVSDQITLEVVVAWEGNILNVSHLSPLRGFTIGEPERHLGASVDFILPSDLLGTPVFDLIVVTGTTVQVRVPRSAIGSLDTQDLGRLGFSDLSLVGGIAPQGLEPGSFELRPGMRTHIGIGRFEIEVELLPAGRTLPKPLVESDTVVFAQTTALTMLAASGILASMAYFVPPLGMTDEESIQKQRLVDAQHYLAALAERERERPREEAEAETPSPEGGSGERHTGEAGSMGSPKPVRQNGHYSVAGPKDNPDPHLARQNALREARAFGLIGILSAPISGQNSPISPFGRDQALGVDDASYNGSMWGPEPGDANGAGGMELTSAGEGGGGKGSAVGMDDVGTLGHGNGTGSGNDFGSGHGRTQLGVHATKVPRVRVAPTTVSGRLPSEVVQRIVRQSFGRFRNCYEAGLRRNPNLEGRVSVHFSIGRDGSVSTSSLGSSDLPDSQVSSCVVSAFYGLGFPKPEGGIVTVTYPILFTPE